MGLDTQVVDAEQLIVKHLDLWTSAQTAKSTAGRGSNNKIELTGIKKLRELILELAVRGKLVPKDPTDEPASELLKQICTEKKALVKSGKLKKLNSSLPITIEENPFEVPQGWEWVRWAEVAFKIGDIDHKMPNEVPDGIPYVSPRDFLGNNKIDFNNAKKISKEDFLRLSEKIQPQLGDLIFPRYGTIGANVLVDTDVDFLASYSCCVIKTFPKLISAKYQFYYSISPLVVRLCKEAENKTTQANVGIKSIQDFCFPLPPLNTQVRIADKVDALMVLCDQLEQQSYQSIDAHNQLVDTLLQTLVNSANADELASNWQRLSEHFDTLFTTEYSIDALKQTILQLAVMGKLVKQDPTDEPASELLKRIAKEKEALVKAGKIKKQKPLPPITDDEKPFELPFSWEWVRIGDVLSLKNGYAFKSQYFVENKTKHILTTPGNFYEKGGFRHRGDKTKYYNGPVDSEYVLATGELIIPMTEQAAGLLGSAAFVPSNEYIYLHNQRLGKLTPHSEITTLEFVYVFFNSSFLREELASTCTGMKVRHTSPDRILEVPIPVMSPTEQLRIVSMVDKLMMFCDLLVSKLNSVKQTQAVLAETLVVHVV